MQRKVVLSFAALLCLTAVAQAATSIVVGNHVLLQNTPGQVIQIIVTGNADPLQGVNLNVQLGDGGPPVGGIDITPDLSDGHVAVPGTIFGSVANSGEGGYFEDVSLIFTGTTTSSGTVSALANGGLLATLVVDTTGFFAGSWPLLLAGTAGGDTNWAGSQGVLDPVITNGSITIVPEPSSVVLGLFGLAGLGALAIRKRRARK